LCHPQLLHVRRPQQLVYGSISKPVIALAVMKSKFGSAESAVTAK
jgi:hypothetical protein